MPESTEDLDTASSTVVPLHPKAVRTAPEAPAVATPNADETIFRLQVQLDMERERALMYRVAASVLAILAALIAREWLLFFWG
jgi:hypothetical protein